MSYEKINFKNREVEKPLTFKKHVNDDGTITLEPKPGTIVEPGTPLLADHFNHMDDGIYKAHKEIDNLKLSGIERNKELVANLNSKKVSATTNDSLKTNIAKVKDIKLGSGNAVTSDVLQGKTFSSSHGTDLTGTMLNNGMLSKTITTQGGKQIITPGYYSGGEVKAQLPNLVPENIYPGISVGGVAGKDSKNVYSSHYSKDNSSVWAIKADTTTRYHFSEVPSPEKIKFAVLSITGNTWDIGNLWTRLIWLSDLSQGESRSFQISEVFDNRFHTIDITYGKDSKGTPYVDCRKNEIWGNWGAIWWTCYY